MTEGPELQKEEKIKNKLIGVLTHIAKHTLHLPWRRRSSGESVIRLTLERPEVSIGTREEKSFSSFVIATTDHTYLGSFGSFLGVVLINEPSRMSLQFVCFYGIHK